MGKLIWSFLISIVVLLIAQKIGWIALGVGLPVLVASVFWNQILWMAIIALVFTAVSYVCGIGYALVIAMTAGAACILLPVYVLGLGYVKLMAVAYLLPGFTFTTVWWKVLILSVFCGVYPASSNSSSD